MKIPSGPLLYLFVKEKLNNFYLWSKTFSKKASICLLASSVLFMSGLADQSIDKLFEQKAKSYLEESCIVVPRESLPATYQLIDMVLSKFYLSNQDIPSSKIKVVVVVNPQINAYAFSSGTVLLNSGILARVGDLSELSGILGHEVAHITNHHMRKQLAIDNALLGLVFLSYGTFGIASVPVTFVFSYLVSLFEKRQSEYAADDFSKELLRQCGFDSTNYGTFLGTKMGRPVYHPPLDDLKEFTYTHPIVYKRAFRVLGP